MMNCFCLFAFTLEAVRCSTFLDSVKVLVERGMPCPVRSWVYIAVFVLHRHPVNLWNNFDVWDGSRALMWA